MAIIHDIFNKAYKAAPLTNTVGMSPLYVSIHKLMEDAYLAGVVAHWHHVNEGGEVPSFNEWLDYYNTKQTEDNEDKAGNKTNSHT